MNILMIYPFDNLLGMTAGNSIYTHRLIDALQSAKFEVQIFTHKEKNTATTKNNCIFFDLKYYNSKWRKRMHLFLKIILGKTLRNKIIADLAHIERFIAFQLDSSFKKKIAKLQDKIDLIVVHYPFAIPVVRAKSLNQTPIIYFTHDILSNQKYHYRIFQQIVRYLEGYSAKCSTACISISPRDRDFFSRNNLNSFWIHSGIPSNNNETKNPAAFRKINKLGNSFICGFVGSNNIPNERAVAKIKEMANQLYPKLKNQIMFVIAGQCSSAFIHENIISLGVLSIDVLNQFYTAMDLFISPLQEGTGTSLKIGEALSHRKPILGTSIAFRSYPVKNKYNALIEDNLDNWPRLIVKLSKNNILREAIVKNSRKLICELSEDNIKIQYIQNIKAIIMKHISKCLQPKLNSKY